MSTHTREDLERLSRLTRRRYSGALMSDTKWRKLFAAVDGSAWRPSLVWVKFVDAGQLGPSPMRWPGPAAFWTPPAWIDTPEFGPIELRAIEWLTIPATVLPPPGDEAPATPQDMAAIRAALAPVGQFPLEDTPDGLRIVGYR